jgi:TonB family protein
VSEPVGPLDPFQFWVVEPKGRTYEGTTAQGLVIRIPLVRFLRYRAFPVFDPKEPKVDRNTTAALFSQLYGLRKQLETNVEQVTLATCGTSCDLEGLRKTQAVLDEFNKTLQALADSLRTEQLELAAQKQYRENHEGNGDVETVVFEQNTISGEQSALKNKDMAYAAWVQGQITRRSAEHAATPAPWQLQGPLYKAGGGVTPPQLVYAPDPQYTDEARREKIQGVSMVSLIVDEEGRPQRIVTLRPLGHGLDEKALEAVRQYHFKPAMLQGKPVPVEANIEVNFRLY